MKGAGWLPRPVTVVGRLRQRFHRGDFLLPFQTVRQTITGSAWKGPRMGTIYLWTILAYLLGLVVVGLKGSRGVASQEDFSVAGRVRELERSSYYYAPRPRNDQGLRGALRKLALRHRRWGYQTLTELLGREGWRDITNGFTAFTGRKGCK